MKRLNFILFMAIFMTIITTAIIIIGFGILDCNRTNLILIIGVSTMGYLGAFLYYDIYLKLKSDDKRRF